MKKVLIAGLIAFALLAVGGTASAWYVDVEGEVCDAALDIQLELTGDVAEEEEEYTFWTTAGVDGSGMVDIFGHGCKDFVDTKVMGEGSIYATQTMIVDGCLEDCGEGLCECPEYVYGATQTAKVDGMGMIDMCTQADDRKDDHHQELFVMGHGDFTAGMGVAYQIEDQDPVIHAMGALGTNVGFSAMGKTTFDETDGDANGWFMVGMGFQDEGCIQECPDCPCMPK